MAAKEDDTNGKKNIPNNVEHISGSADTSSTSDTAKTATKKNTHTSNNPASKKAEHTEKKTIEQPVKDRFWRGFFNGASFFLVVAAIPLIFGLQLGANQNESLFKAKQDIVELKIAQLQTEIQLQENQLANFAENESAILMLIDEKQKELNSIAQETQALAKDIEQNKASMNSLKTDLQNINKKSTKGVLTENLPEAPRMQLPFNN